MEVTDVDVLLRFGLRRPAMRPREDVSPGSGESGGECEKEMGETVDARREAAIMFCLLGFCCFGRRVRSRLDDEGIH